MRQIVLLRGVNLGARNRLAMAPLRELLSTAGYVDVRTYLQSGNVVLSSDSTPDELARECELQIARAFGLQIDVLVRTREELAAVVEHNPLGGVAVDPKLHQVIFLERKLNAESSRALVALARAPERLVVMDRELYAWHPNGIARSPLARRLAARGLGVSATARNWTTVTKLLAIAEE
jgi:uncharacterized protein (DUF1697 family)